MFDALPYENDSVQYLIAANLFLTCTIDIYPFSQATREFDFMRFPVIQSPLFQFILFQQLAELFPFFHKNVFIQLFHFHTLFSILLLTQCGSTSFVESGWNVVFFIMPL